MPLPLGFKVNGSKITTSNIPTSPREKKIMALLDKMPMAELLTSAEVSERLGADIHGGRANSSNALREYREKVDNKLFWGSRKSIAKLREQLVTSEEPHDKN